MGLQGAAVCRSHGEKQDPAPSLPRGAGDACVSEDASTRLRDAKKKYGNEMHRDLVLGQITSDLTGARARWEKMSQILKKEQKNILGFSSCKFTISSRVTTKSLEIFLSYICDFLSQ